MTEAQEFCEEGWKNGMGTTVTFIEDNNDNAFTLCQDMTEGKRLEKGVHDVVDLDNKEPISCKCMLKRNTSGWRV